MATTGSMPKPRTIDRCLNMLEAPARTSSRFSSNMAGGSSLPETMRYLPEWAFRARTVTTRTAASGRIPDTEHLRSKKRSKPMSAPKPASVRT